MKKGDRIIWTSLGIWKAGYLIHRDGRHSRVVFDRTGEVREVWTDYLYPLPRELSGEDLEAYGTLISKLHR